MGVPTIKIANARGQELNLSDDPRYLPILTGTGPVAATINRSKMATADGTQYNSGTVGERNLLLTIYLRRDVARARLNLYRYIVTKQPIRVYYQNDGLDVYLDGYVETADVDPWTREENMAVSIICPMPYWQDVAESYADASHVAALFEFPFAIDSSGVELSTRDETRAAVVDNGGHVATGVTIELVATEQSLNPRIYNLTTGAYIGFYVGMFAGDRLVICTEDGKKSVTLIRDGVETDCFNTIMDDIDWLALEPGPNDITYTVDEGNMTLAIRYTNKYQGV